jgi:hypothetical protein
MDLHKNGNVREDSAGREVPDHDRKMFKKGGACKERKLL